MKKQDVVFTALFGQYETLNEITIFKNPKTKYVCFTDDPTLKSKTWEVRVIKTIESRSPARVSREIKMLGHKYFPEGTRSLYIDNTVGLKMDGGMILDEWLKEADVALMEHTIRKTVRGEFFACSAYGLDDQKIIWNQYRHYKQFYPVVLKQKPYWGGMIARVNNAKTDKLMETWKQQFDIFAKRDQLCLNASELISGVKIVTIVGKNDVSKWHAWPISANRQIKMRDKTSGRRFRKLRIILNALIYGIRLYNPL